MIVKSVFWKVSDKKQILGDLVVEGDSVVFANRDSEYAPGTVRVMTKTQHNQEKVGGFFSKLFKKAANVQEDFSILKSDISGLTVTSSQVPDYDMKGKAIPGKFHYSNIVQFSANGQSYFLSVSSPGDDFGKELEELLKA
ncbi:hypothetical protein LJC34_05820 [Oscillospiraceae bacterium OttesenSCG-928-G22]|nr:hypothetical protein [Oscillospiraceae bacterium OttesenSCG-928-G22]